MTLALGILLRKVSDGPVHLQRVRLEVVDDLAAFTPNDKVAGPDRRAREDKVLPVDLFCWYRAHPSLRETNGVGWQGKAWEA